MAVENSLLLSRQTSSLLVIEASKEDLLNMSKEWLHLRIGDDFVKDGIAHKVVAIYNQAFDNCEVGFKTNKKPGTLVKTAKEWQVILTDKLLLADLEDDDYFEFESASDVTFDDYFKSVSASDVTFSKPTKQWGKDFFIAKDGSVHEVVARYSFNQVGYKTEAKSNNCGIRTVAKWREYGIEDFSPVLKDDDVVIFSFLKDVVPFVRNTNDATTSKYDHVKLGDVFKVDGKDKVVAAIYRYDTTGHNCDVAYKNADGLPLSYYKVRCDNIISNIHNDTRLKWRSAFDVEWQTEAKKLEPMTQQTLKEAKAMANKHGIKTRTEFINQVEPTTQQKLEKDSSMGKFLDTTKKDITKAGIRVAGNQLNKLIVKVILTLLRKQGFTRKAEVSVLERFFSTPMGNAFVAMAAGQLLTFAPYLKDQEKVQMLAEELRINGYATAGNELIDFVQENFIGDIMGIIKALPIGGEEEEAKALPVAKHRIATKPHLVEEEEEEQAKVPAARGRK